MDHPAFALVALVVAILLAACFEKGNSKSIRNGKFKNKESEVLPPSEGESLRNGQSSGKAD